MNWKYPKITHGRGVYIFDDSGKKYLDASAGSCAVANIGHGRHEIRAAISRQVNKVTVLPTHEFNSHTTERYLTNLVEYTGNSFSKAWTAMSGTEAVENAIKLAFQYHQLCGNSSKYKIISRWSAYHGNSIFTLDIGGMKARRDIYKPWLNNFPHVSAAYPYRKASDLSDSEYVDSLLGEFEECIIRENPSTIAAFIAEPVVGAALGAVVPPKGYFRGIKKICEKYNILFVSDEVLTGFGRTGKHFGFENFEFTPDIVAAGKGISGGYYPLSAVISTSKIFEPFKSTNTPFLGGHTFACNPVGAAVGDEVISILNRENLIENSFKQGKLLRKMLVDLSTKYDIIGEVRGLGLQCGIEFVQDRITKRPFPKSLNLSRVIASKSMGKGVVLYPGGGSFDGVMGDHILITPPLTISENEICTIVGTLEECLSEVDKEVLKVRS